MNHLQTPEYKELLELILKSEGKTIEDELGLNCKILTEDGIFTVLSVEWNEFKEYGKVKTIDDTAVWRWDKNKSEFEVLGRPITLDRVLMALEKKNNNDESVRFISTDGEFVDNEYCSYEPKLCWKLGSPLHLQPLETIKKLLGIFKT